MATTEYVGQKICANFFPSIKSYDKNKESLSETDINFVPAQTVIKTYRDGTSWYRIWSDGWIEQGGYQQFTHENIVTLFTSFTTTDYNIITTSSCETLEAGTIMPYNKTKTNFTVNCGNGSDNSLNVYGYWYAYGY